jgi:hypothetical protein
MWHPAAAREDPESIPFDCQQEQENEFPWPDYDRKRKESGREYGSQLFREH